MVQGSSILPYLQFYSQTFNFHTMRHTIELSKKELAGSDYRRFVINIRLDDECNNGHMDFSITGSGWYKNSRTQGANVCGCVHEEILKFRPDLKIFVALHLSDAHGAPMYAVENGYYHFINSPLSVFENYMRIDYATSKVFLDSNLKISKDKRVFTNLIVELGIDKAWQIDANQGIELLESLTGQTFVDTSRRYNFTPIFSGTLSYTPR